MEGIINIPRCHRGNGLRDLLLTTALTAASLLALPAHALPTGGQVIAGQATVSTSGSLTTVTQATDRGVINWQSFDIAHGERVHFQQPTSSSVTLNRVTGGQGASQIMGQISATGTVMLVNPNGVIFGPTSQVNVGSLVATTADIANDRFMAGDYHFDRPGRSDAGIVNQGHITVSDAGLALFVAPNVVNDGIIAAEGGKVLLTAAAAGDVVNSLINMDGIVSATSIGEQNGEIVIFAEGSNAVAGNDTAKKGQKSGSSTVLVSGVLDASGRGEGERGGKITVTGDNVALLNGTVIDASGHTGASSTTAGKAVSAHRKGSAGGDIRIGGDYLGQGDTPTARNLYVDPGALILNDAIHTGDAGRTILWSDGTTQFYGNVYARALGGKPVDPLTWSATADGNSGDGGFVETSGHEHLDAGGYVDLTASNGNRGTYFLDPTDITIYGNVDPAFVSTDGSIDLASSLRLWLDASDTSMVTLTYSTDGLSSATATGTAGSNTITTSANVSANLAVGARIRLGSAGEVTTADTMGDHTYTIASISGTTITLAENLTQNYSGSTLHRGLVSQLADKSGQNNNATQTTAANMPLWVSNTQNALGTTRYDGSDLLLNMSSPVIGSLFQHITNTASGYPGYFTGNSDPGGVNFWFLGNGASSLYGPGSYLSSAYVNGSTSNSWVVGAPTLLSGTTDTPTSGINGFRIGNDRGHGTRYMNGTSSEVLAYEVALPADARRLIEQYQSAKWGVALTPPGTGATEAAKAMASNGYSAFTTRYLERLSQSANISLQATNNITLDPKGDTLALASDRNFSLTTTSGNISSASAGTITTARTGSGGNINITAGGTGNITLSDVSLNASGGGQVNLSAGGSISVTQPLALNLGTVSGTSVLLRTTNSTADVTVNGAISASASGTAITLASGRHFINNAGTGALSTPSGRWLVYSTNPTNDTIGSLANGFRRFSCAYGGSCPSFPASGNGFLYSYTPMLTVAPTSGYVLDRGDAAPNLIGYGYNLSGYLSGDALLDSVTGSLNGSTPYTTSSNAGTYAIHHASGALTSALGYGFIYASNPSAIKVKAPQPVPGVDLAASMSQLMYSANNVIGRKRVAVSRAFEDVSLTEIRDGRDSARPSKRFYNILESYAMIVADPSLMFLVNIPKGR